MAEREVLLDPTGDSERTADLTLTPRPRGLRGLTVGLVENNKPNSGVVLTEVGRQLRESYGVRAQVLYAKGYFGTPVEESVIQRILKECDFAVAGIGD